jgi:hypothetical protein
MPAAGSFRYPPSLVAGAGGLWGGMPRPARQREIGWEDAPPSVPLG